MGTKIDAAIVSRIAAITKLNPTPRTSASAIASRIQMAEVEIARMAIVRIAAICHLGGGFGAIDCAKNPPKGYSNFSARVGADFRSVRLDGRA